MYCVRCRSLVSDRQSFCAACGAPTKSAEAARIEQARSLRDMFVVVIACALFGMVLIAVLHKVAVWISGIALLIFAISWSIRGVSKWAKLAFLAIALLLAITVENFEATNDRKEAILIARQASTAAALKAQARHPF